VEIPNNKKMQMRHELHYPQILNHFKNEWGEKWLEFITVEMGCRNDKGKPYGNVFSNKNFTMDMLQKHMPTTCQFQCLSDNPNLTIDVVKKYQKRKWAFKDLCANPNLKIDDLMKLRKFFDWRYICRNPNFTFDYVLQHPQIKWNWMWISSHKNVTMDIIEHNMDKPWDWYYVCQNPNLTIEFVRKHMDKWAYWCWEEISRNSAITMDIIENNRDLPWNWVTMQYNPNLTINTIEKHPEKEWNALFINPRKEITMQHLRETQKRPNSWTICKENFDEDRNIFISYRFSWLFLVAIYEYYCEMSIDKKRKRFGYGDMVFANDYLMNMIVKY
jgi:hypothetical protein